MSDPSLFKSKPHPRKSLVLSSLAAIVPILFIFGLPFVEAVHWRNVGEAELLPIAADSKPTASSVSLFPKERGATPVDLSLSLTFSTPKFTNSALLVSSIGPHGISVVIGKDKSLSLQAFHPRPFGIDQKIASDLEENQTYRLQLRIRHPGQFSGSVSNINRKNEKVQNFEFENSRAFVVFNQISVGANPGGGDVFNGRVEVQKIRGNFIEERTIWHHLQRFRLICVILAFLGILAFLRQPFWSRSSFEALDRSRVITGLVIVGFFFAVVYHFVQGFYLGAPYPQNSFLFIKGIQFTDYLSERANIGNLNPYPSSYPPLIYLLSYPISLIGNAGLEIISMSSLFLISFFVLAFRTLKPILHKDAFLAAFALCFMTYPVLFLIDRGNLDFLVFPFIFWGLVELSLKRYRRAAFAIGVASACKIVPVIFYLIFLRRRKFAELIGSIVFIVLLSVLSAMAFKTGVVGTFEMMWTRIQTSYSDWTLVDVSAYGSHSLKGFVRILRYNFLGSEFEEGSQDWHRGYRIFSGLLFVATVSFVYARGLSMALWKQITLLSLTPLLLLFFSPDYKLVVLIAPAVLFIVSAERDRSDWVYAILFGLIFIPKEYVRLPYVAWPPYFDGIGLGPIFNPVLLMLIGSLIVLSEIDKMRTTAVAQSAPA